MCKKCNFFSGILVGSVLGGIAALFMAPETGKNMRKCIKNLIEENSDVLNQAKENTETLIQKTKEAIEDGFENLNKIIDEKKKCSKASDEVDVEK